jgi:homoserine kinase type II
MAIKTVFTPDDFVKILSQYDLGIYLRSEAIQQGTVQTNFYLETTEGRFVFRYYENRAKKSVLFESHLLAFLTEQSYPCPAQLKDVTGSFVNIYHHKPYAIFEFLDGQHIEKPTNLHKQQLIEKAAQLQKLTMGYYSPYTAHRWNYSPELCQTLAQAKAAQINNKAANEKLAWLIDQLTTLDLPPSLPKGICHCDFHFSNVLFRGDEFAALLDFDDANYTFLPFDLVGLIENWAWPYMDTFNMVQAHEIVQEYSKHRPLTPSEQLHLYDVYKLSILFDCIWFFARGYSDDFYEKRKIEALTNLGRQKFWEQLFPN